MQRAVREGLVRLSVFVVIVIAGLAQAAPRTLVVGTGSCQSVELVTALNEFGGALREQLKADLYESDVVLDIVRPRPSRTIEDIERQVESARTLFYNGQNDRSLDLIKQALSELERAPTVGQPWRVLAPALTLQGVVLLTAGKKTDALDSFRRVLRVEPQYALNADDFTPGVIAQFEALRKELSRSRKSAVVVQSTPPGAEIVVEGRVIGTTPLKFELLPASYRLLVRSGDRSSFLRVLTTPRDSLVQIDLASEGALATKSPLCLSATGKAAEAAALKLANTVTADDVVIVRLEGAKDGPGQLAAARFEIRSGAMLREGRVLSPTKGKPAYEALATFLLTGQGSAAVLTPEAAAKAIAPQVVAEPVAVVQPAVVTPPVATTEPVAAPKIVEAPPPAPPVVTATNGMSTARVMSFSLMGVGAAALVAGAITFGLGTADRAAASMRQVNGKLPDPAEPEHRRVLDAINRADLNQTIAFTFLGAGVGAATAGLLTFFLFPGSEVPQVAIVPSSGSLSVTIGQSF